MNNDNKTQQGNEHQRNQDLSTPGAANPFNKKQPVGNDEGTDQNEEMEKEQTFKEALTERD